MPCVRITRMGELSKLLELTAYMTHAIKTFPRRFPSRICLTLKALSDVCHCEVSRQTISAMCHGRGFTCKTLSRVLLKRFHKSISAMCHCGVYTQTNFATCHCRVSSHMLSAVCHCGVSIQNTSAICHCGICLQTISAMCHC